MDARQAKRIVMHWVAGSLAGDSIYDSRLSYDDNVRIERAMEQVCEEMLRRSGFSDIMQTVDQIVDAIAPNDVVPPLPPTVLPKGRVR